MQRRNLPTCSYMSALVKADVFREWLAVSGIILVHLIFQGTQLYPHVTSSFIHLPLQSALELSVCAVRQWPRARRPSSPRRC